MSSILGPFRIFKASATCLSAYNLQTSVIAFLIAFAYYIIISIRGSKSAICRYALKTNNIRIRLSKLKKLFIALNVICKAASLLVLNSLVTII